MGFVVLVSGSREFENRPLMFSVLSGLLCEHPSLSVIHGGAAGADSLAGSVCADLGIPVRVFSPDWSRFGRRAGLVRNQQMIDSGVDLCVAFFVTGSPCSGTCHCVGCASRAGVPVRYFVDSPSADSSQLDLLSLSVRS